ncbi:MAG: DUF1549 domain-containing protein, partial [Planctomycetales bacterium]|nr:DUF1549 domain-containing protein [Planctomycetales bacterium]
MMLPKRICQFTASIAALCLAYGARADVGRAQQPDFQRDIRPILSDHCFACHGPDEHQRKAELRFDADAESLTEQGIINLDDPAQSELLRRVLATDPDEQMPPPSFGKPLEEKQIALLRRWLDSGAKWAQHWAFRSPQRTAIPATQSMGWARNPIDDFVLAKLESLKLQPSSEAEPATRLRRLFFDLTGLPPSLQQLDEFLADPSDAAYEAWVDKLLASPHFGERMTLAWLDQARYADTNGYSIDGGRHMSLWRDWVIDAYNRNMPFDQFLLEQMAGDLLPNATPDQLVATGFHRNHMITHEGGTIPAENLVNYTADRVKTTGEVFLGLTLGCAQCHDHKFDPITQRDYYRLFAYFNELSDRGLDGDGGRNAAPTIMAHSVMARDQQQVAKLRDELVQIEEQLRAQLPSQTAWEAATRQELARLGEQLELHPAQVLKVSAPNRTGESEVLPDGTVYFRNGSDRSPSVSTKIDADNITALRLEFLPDEHFPHAGLGHGNERGLPGSFLLTAFNASATELPADQVDLYRTLAIADATASASHPEFPPQGCLNEEDFNGWSPHPHNQTPQHITFHLSQPLNASETPYVTFMVVWGGGPYGGGAALSGGKYRLYAVTGRDDDSNVPVDVRELLHLEPSQRTAEQAERVRAYYASVAPETANLRYRRAIVEQRIKYLTEPQSAMVMDSAAQPRETSILNRGQYDQQREGVTAGMPASLLPPLEPVP